MSGDRVLGVDACRSGWVGVELSTDGVRGYLGSDIADLVTHAERDGELRVVGIDIPIGLPDEGRRTADELAKQAVGPRRSSVFMTPVRDALLAPGYWRARASTSPVFRSATTASRSTTCSTPPRPRGRHAAS